MQDETTMAEERTAFAARLPARLARQGAMWAIVCQVHTSEHHFAYRKFGTNTKTNVRYALVQCRFYADKWRRIVSFIVGVVIARNKRRKSLYWRPTSHVTLQHSQRARRTHVISACT
ncbi:hypothetical protein EVAR_15736_1 [Eumeta japonica]|uniref:Uncharacterized protein n=1 Tax=Eumeta variegata TaxID=151549 RepID=A0A4C1U9M0_EUMVA|nr:hypothetical protein EVAR_15736_1 [Eumeta japonica]